MQPQFVGVTGLPRAGSTLLCQLLAEHPAIACEGHSSPLCNALLATRRSISSDPFFLAQLDVQFDLSYAHLQSALQGFLRGWYAGTDKPLVVDKNRAWLHCVEYLLQIAPEARLLVCLRDLTQVYGSIEAQHQKTICLDFIDQLADFDRLGRADQLFAKDKIIGAPLVSIQALQDLPQAVRDRVFFVRLEDMLERPVQTMASVYRWLGLAEHRFNPERLQLRAHESDSHFHHKYLHRQYAAVQAARSHPVPARVQALIHQACRWYYAWFYPEVLARTGE